LPEGEQNPVAIWGTREKAFGAKNRRHIWKGIASEQKEGVLNPENRRDCSRVDSWARQAALGWRRKERRKVKKGVLTEKALKGGGVGWLARKKREIIRLRVQQETST